MALVANVTVMAALLYYFGWRRTQAQDQRLGLDPEIFGLGPQDYVLRSVGPVFGLLAILGAAALAAAYAHAWLARRVRTAGRKDVAVRAALVAGAVAWLALPAIAVTLNALWPSNGYVYVATPLAVGAGVLLLLYRQHLRQALGEPPAEGLALARVAVVVITFVSLFWAASNYAVVDGTDAADSFIRNFRQQGGVVLYSAKSLSLAGGTEEDVGTADATYRYRYTGLWLVTRIGGSYFLVGDDWDPVNGTFIMVADDDPAIRIEFTPARR